MHRLVMTRARFAAGFVAATLLALLPLLMFIELFVAAVIICEGRGIVRFTWKPAFWLMLVKRLASS